MIHNDDLVFQNAPRGFKLAQGQGNTTWSHISCWIVVLIQQEESGMGAPQQGGSSHASRGNPSHSV